MMSTHAYSQPSDSAFYDCLVVLMAGDRLLTRGSQVNLDLLTDSSIKLHICPHTGSHGCQLEDWPVRKWQYDAMLLVMLVSYTRIRDRCVVALPRLNLKPVNLTVANVYFHRTTLPIDLYQFIESSKDCLD